MIGERSGQNANCRDLETYAELTVCVCVLSLGRSQLI